ncbi:MAG: beta-N-acetylhexosaminidase [bacterium]
MQLRDRVGQLFMLGSDRRDQRGFTEHLAKLHAGGAVLFSRDIHDAEQVRSLCDGITGQVVRSCGIRPLIAVDQEGGPVSRLRPPLCPELQDAASLGQLYAADPQAAISKVHDQADLTAQCLLDLHINMNFAPVCDLQPVEHSDVLEGRCFGADPEVVEMLAGAYAQRLQARGVIATAKHFPGHGATGLDSHAELPVSEVSQDELLRDHVSPFAGLVRAGIGAVMLSHVVYPGLDHKPACQSASIVDGMLQRKLGFPGLIITDDMQMAAIRGEQALPGACLQVLLAGCSMILICADPGQQQQVLEYVTHAAESGELPEAILEQAVTRNLRLKRRFGLI